MKKLEIAIVVIVIIVILVGGYYRLNQEKPEEYTGPIEKITLAAYAGDTGSLVYIAEEQGFFKENGLDIIINDYEAGKLATDALLEGKSDISTATDSVFVSNSFNNPDLRTFGTVALANINSLVARKDKDINQISDIKGKKIGVTKKSTGEFYLGSFLLFNGLSFSDVELIDLAPSEIVNAIVNGEIDAGFTWDPNIYNIEKVLGDNAISWPGQSNQNFYFILITRENWLQNNKEASKRFLKAIIQAEEYMKSNPNEVKQFIKNKFGLEQDYIDYSWKKHDFKVILPQAMLTMLEDQARWRIENNLTDITEIPNYLDYINMNLLKEIKPGAVTMIH